MVSILRFKTSWRGVDRFPVHGIMYGEVYNGWAKGRGVEWEFGIF